MSHFTLDSGQRTETHRSYCPVCRVPREYRAPLPGGWVLPLGCTVAHQHQYVANLQRAGGRLGIPRDSFAAGLIPEGLSRRMQETLLGTAAPARASPGGRACPWTGM